MAANVNYKVVVNNRSALAAITQVQAHAQRISGNLSKGISGGIGGLFAIGAITAGIKSIADFGDHVNDVSNKLQIATDDVQALERAAKLSGVEFGKIEAGMVKANSAAEKALGGDTKKTVAFAQLGINKDDLQHLNKKDLAVKASQGVQKLDTATGDKAFADIFGEKLGPAMRQAAEEMANLEETKKRMIASGQIMSDADIAKLDAFKDEVAIFTNQLMVQATPALTSILDALKWFWNGIYDLAELAGTAAGAFSTIIGEFDIVGLLTSFGENFVNTIKAILENAWGLVTGKKTIGDVVSAAGEQMAKNDRNTLTKTFGEKGVASVGQAINDKLLEQAERDRQRKFQAEERDRMRKEQQAAINQPTNRTGNNTPAKAASDFKPEQLASVGNLSFGGTAAINAQQRITRISEKSLEYQQKMYQELVLQRQIMEEDQQAREED